MLPTTKRPNCYSKSFTHLWSKKVPIVKTRSINWSCYREIRYEIFSAKVDTAVPTQACLQLAAIVRFYQFRLLIYITTEQQALAFLHMPLPGGGGWRLERVNHICRILQGPWTKKGWKLHNHTTSALLKQTCRNNVQTVTWNTGTVWVAVSLLGTHYGNDLAHALASYNTAFLSSSIIWQ